MIVDVVYGFLGSGKTTFIRHILKHPPAQEKLVVLVNEFGEVGLDGAFLKMDDSSRSDIIELPSGCICCTIASDFRRQITELCQDFDPDRLIIEPTGVAVITQITDILEKEDIQPLYSFLNLIHVIDASEFLSFMKAQRYYMENQLRACNTVILNKTDLVKSTMINLLVESIKEINPEVRVFPTEHAAVDPETLSDILGKEDHRSTETKAESPDIHYEMEGERHHAHGETYGMERFVSFGERYPDELFDGACVASFFEDLKKRKFGEVARAKGIFRIEDGWIRMELASGQIQKDKLDEAEQSAVSIIGEFLNTAGIKSRLRSCRVE